MSEADRETAMRSCRFCPMCHHADLVTTLERRETYSARGRGLTLFTIEQGKAAWGREVADVMYRFFADGLCQHVCAGHIPHDALIIDARQRLVAAGHAPKAVAQIKANIENTGNPWGAEEPDLSSLTGAHSRSDVLVYFGPAARIHRPAAIRALATLLKAAGVNFSILSGESDPGLLLHQLGETAAGAAAANALADKIAQSGARTVITADADAYQTFKSGCGKAPALSGTQVRHAAEFLAEIAGRFTWRRPQGLNVAYHDPCALARVASCIDAPRALIQKICEVKPLEIGVWSRDLANCSGECGGVPFTYPELSEKAADRRVREAREAGAEIIVAGSPAAAMMLKGRGLPVRELCEYVVESLN